MNNDIKDKVREAYAALSPELKEAITAADLPDKIKSIGNTYNLLIDQLGVLENEVVLVMLGIEPSSGFISNIVRELSISQKTASAIATDVNSSIFDSIKEHLQAWEKAMADQEKAGPSDEDVPPAPHQDLSAIEHAGGFDIEKEQDEGEVSITHDDKAKILSSLENPQKSPETVVKKTPDIAETHTDSLVDHLLSMPTTQTEQKIVQKAPAAPTAPVAPAPKPIQPPRTGPDSYREPIQ